MEAGHEDVPKTVFVRQPSRVHDILQIRQRLCIGVGDARAVVLQAQINDLLGRKIIMANIRWRYLRNLMILTVQTPEVAARTGNGETLGVRMEVVQRLFLNGINGQRTGLAIDFADEHTVLITTAPTDTRLAIRNLTMMRTEQTLHPSIIQPLIVFALHQNTIAS